MLCFALSGCDYWATSWLVAHKEGGFTPDEIANVQSIIERASSDLECAPTCGNTNEVDGKFYTCFNLDYSPETYSFCSELKKSGLVIHFLMGSTANSIPKVQGRRSTLLLRKIEFAIKTELQGARVESCLEDCSDAPKG